MLQKAFLLFYSLKRNTTAKQYKHLKNIELHKVRQLMLNPKNKHTRQKNIECKTPRIRHFATFVYFN